MLRKYQSFQPHKPFMRMISASIENTEHLLTLPQLYACSIVSFTLPFFGRCSATIDIVTALTMIHYQAKLQITLRMWYAGGYM